MSNEEGEKMKSQFFDSGLQIWYNFFCTLTFDSCFVDLSKEASEEIIAEHDYYMKNKKFSSQIFISDSLLSKLANEISMKIKEQKNLKKYLIKHSTRSPMILHYS